MRPTFQAIIKYSAYYIYLIDSAAAKECKCTRLGLAWKSMKGHFSFGRTIHCKRNATDCAVISSNNWFPGIIHCSEHEVIYPLNRRVSQTFLPPLALLLRSRNVY